MDPLAEAIKNRDLPTVRTLLDQDAEAASRPLPGGMSPLLLALYAQAQEVVDLLLQRVRPDVFEASALGDAPYVEQLLGADPRRAAEYSGDGWTALHLACFFGRAAVAHALLEGGAAVDAVSHNDLANTPLHAALAGAGNPQVMDLLLGFGADPNARAHQGVAPLHLAASRGSGELVELLYRAGGDPAAAMDGGRTPADLARERGHTGLAAELCALDPQQ